MALAARVDRRATTHRGRSRRKRRTRACVATGRWPAVGPGAVALAPRLTPAQAPAAAPVAPPSTVTTPPRDFGPNGAAERLLHRSRRPHRRSRVQRPAPAQRADPAAVDGRAVVRGAGVERPGPLPRLERHPQQPAAALARGRRPRERVPHAVEQQQRQHVRLPGAPALVRAPDAPRRPLRARRLDHGDRRHVRRQAAELAERRRPAPGRQLLVHRSAVRRPALRGRARRGRRAEQPAGRLKPRLGQAARRSATHKRELPHGRLPRRSERPRRPGRRRGPGARSQRARASRPTTRSSTWSAPAAGPATPAPAARATCTCSTSAPTTRLSNRKVFSDFMVDGVKCGPDGVRCDVDGNVWCSSNAGRAVGYSGVTVWTPRGQADRPHPPARGVRQHLLRRAQAQPAVHGREPVALRALHGTQGAAPG